MESAALTTVPATRTKRSAWLPAIALLLLALLALECYREWQRVTLIARVQGQIETFQDSSSDLLYQYHKAAYADPELKGIAQQQFRALESIMQYQQLLIEQNNAILALLAEIR